MAHKRETTESFIAKSKSKHGNRYVYTKTHYGKNQKDPVTIICRVHGDFVQLPYNHLQGKGCDLCANIRRARKRSLTVARFIEKSINIHGNLYSYSSITSIKNNRSRLPIFCYKCDMHFAQLASVHLRGGGCPECNKSLGWGRSQYEDVPTTLYIIQFSDNLYKIGITTQTVLQRYRRETKVYSILYEQIYSNGVLAFDAEKELLRLTKVDRYTGTFLQHGGDTELRTTNPLNYL